ncbi:MAG: glycosyltransferase family 87 protein [Gemmatimonadota bacterium]|nr:glycosyltransferase family 87 protein [Gemmatimonadota bacterium]
MALLYVLTAVLVTIQRGDEKAPHTTFRIFRWSFRHLVAGRDLYAYYPRLQGAGIHDLFKYSPTGAFLFAPFSVLPFRGALLVWSALGALSLLYAFDVLLPRRDAIVAAALLWPDLLASLQSCSSNAFVAALIVAAFVNFERQRQANAAAAIVTGAAIKLFPLAALSLAVVHPRQRRFAAWFVLVGLIAVLVPLLVTDVPHLLQQYRSWMVVEQYDASDLAFGESLMHLVRTWVGGAWPNWPMQVVGTLVLLAPLAIRRNQANDPGFRLQLLASILMYVVLFNHQAEHQSFVISSFGVALWCTASPSRAVPRAGRYALALLAVSGLGPAPLAAVWLLTQLELAGWTALAGRTAGGGPASVPAYAGTPASPTSS